jgi:heat shock protein HtpX
MATLYTQADKNIRKTWIYIAGFLIFVILIGWLISYLLDDYIILVIAVAYSFFTSFLSYWYSDKIVLSMAGARFIEKKDNPELYRLVENLCIASGLPLPKIYIMSETQPNAFATGRNPKNSAIAVTQGLLERLDRPEIEGVIAHELSHIKDRDTLLQTAVVVLTGVIVLLTNLFFRFSFYGRSRNRNEKDGLGLIFLAISIILIVLAPVLATLIKLAISRKREFLADANGALLTRYPEGLARALEKISQDSHPLNTAVNSTAHLYIESPFKGEQGQSWLNKLFMTHPSVTERVKALRVMSF